jgi:hypothetical protein
MENTMHEPPALHLAPAWTPPSFQYLQHTAPRPEPSFIGKLLAECCAHGQSYEWISKLSDVLSADESISVEDCLSIKRFLDKKADSEKSKLQWHVLTDDLYLALAVKWPQPSHSEGLRTLLTHYSSRKSVVTHDAAHPPRPKDDWRFAYGVDHEATRHGLIKPPNSLKDGFVLYPTYHADDIKDKQVINGVTFGHVDHEADLIRITGLAPALGFEKDIRVENRCIHGVLAHGVFFDANPIEFPALPAYGSNKQLVRKKKGGGYTSLRCEQSPAPLPRGDDGEILMRVVGEKDSSHSSNCQACQRGYGPWNEPRTALPAFREYSPGYKGDKGFSDGDDVPETETYNCTACRLGEDHELTPHCGVIVGVKSSRRSYGRETDAINYENKASFGWREKDEAGDVLSYPTEYSIVMQWLWKRLRFNRARTYIPFQRSAKTGLSILAPSLFAAHQEALDREREGYGRLHGPIELNDYKRAASSPIWLKGKHCQPCSLKKNSVASRWCQTCLDYREQDDKFHDCTPFLTEGPKLWSPVWAAWRADLQDERGRAQVRLSYIAEWERGLQSILPQDFLMAHKAEWDNTVPGHFEIEIAKVWVKTFCQRLCPGNCLAGENGTPLKNQSTRGGRVNTASRVLNDWEGNNGDDEESAVRSDRSSRDYRAKAPPEYAGVERGRICELPGCDLELDKRDGSRYCTQAHQIKDWKRKKKEERSKEKRSC